MTTTRREQYMKTAQDIVNHKIVDVRDIAAPCTRGVLYKCGTWGSGMWRSAWAFDTLIDCFTLFPVVDCKSGESFEKRMLNTYLMASHGDWWDDFGWCGIASLRAAERRSLFPNTWQDFLKNAINCWCYMYGPGWSKPPDQKPEPPSEFTVPFLDVAGWKDFIEKKNHYNIGAVNVWQYASDDLKKKFPPRFTPGGLWNSTLSDGRPAPTDKQPSDCSCYSSGKDCLASTQNTVTNALFTILTLRLYIASFDAAFTRVFIDSKVNRDRVLKAWQNQMDWFNKWFFPVPQDNVKSLLYPLSQNYSPGNGMALARERVSTFGTGLWDSSYCPKLAWTGDQGLMLAALREADQFLRSNDCPYKGDAALLQTAAVYKDILKGVAACCFGKENIPSYNDILFLRPWVQVTLDSNYKISLDFSSKFPQGDNEDYQTGCGIFHRYLLQAYASDAQVVAPYKNNVLAAADAICKSNFPDPGLIDNLCDCLMVDSNGTPCDRMTPWINRLALLCMGIALADS